MPLNADVNLHGPESIYAEPFNENTNRLVRERSTGTGRTGFSE